jgi:hypothetical protein
VILPALRSFVWGISETDLVTFTAAVVGLGSVALLALLRAGASRDARRSRHRVAVLISAGENVFLTHQADLESAW